MRRAGGAVRDVALLSIFIALAGLVWRTPWLGVLALAFLGYMHPQGYAEGFLHGAPVFAAFFMLTAVALFFRQDQPWADWLQARGWLLHDWRVRGLVAFWLFTALTSAKALDPAAAWPQWIEFTKVVATVGLTLLVIDQPRKLDALLLVIALSIGLVAVKGGYWALIHGAQDRVHGSPAGHFADNNHFVVANLMALPIFFYFMSSAREQAVRWSLGIAIGFGLVAVLSSWSRGGLLGLAATAIVLSSTSRRRLAAIAVAGSLGLAAVALMPNAWLARMETIASAGKEASAASRLAFWEIGLEAGAARPLWGWGFDSYAVLTGGAEWHSSYVQVFAEHGLIGSALWLSLLLGSILLLASDVLRPHAEQRHRDLPALSRALLASLVAYAVGGAFLGIAYWDIFFHLIAIAVLSEKMQNVPRLAR